MKLTTTLNKLKNALAYTDEVEKLLRHIGHDYDPDQPINLLTILKSNDRSFFFWSFRALEQNWKEAHQILASIATDIAESVSHIFEEKYPDNEIPRKALEAARAKSLKKLKTATSDALGTAIHIEYKTSPTYAAANAAKSVAYAAGAVIRKAKSERAAAANLSAWSAAHAVDAVSRPVVERKKQIEIIKKYLTA